MVAACPFPYARGTPVRIYRMAEALERRGHEVHVITYHLGADAVDARFTIHRIRQVQSYRNCEPGPTLGKLLLLDPLLTLKLAQVLRQIPFDVVHAHHYEGLLAAGASPTVRGIPVVFDAHTLLSSELPFYSLGVGTRMKSFIGHLFDRYLPGRAAHVVAVTHTIRDRLIAGSGLRPERITVVTNGVETGLFDAASAVELPGRFTVVFAGNLASYQGIEHLLHALRLVREKRDDVRLAIVTESSFDRYDALARSLGVRDHIDLINGPFEKVPALLLGATIATNPRTHGEGVPQKVMNYMAAARPIVSFRGTAAHLRHDQTALLVPDGDTTAFANAILCLLDDPARAARLGATARAEIDRVYSWDRTAEQMEKVYAKVLQPQPRRGVRTEQSGRLVSRVSGRT